ncbi:hypothetical protein [Pedobacter jeongneungensis]|uniref:hypothetical protein n=1 Tax=Pedobacter jeongneungensis TaxID=947309 RepID=UPI00046A49A8|nr:hypothetical protein [Pedobacter jeongneungensis]
MKTPVLIIGYTALICLLLFYLLGTYFGIFHAQPDFKDPAIPKPTEIIGYTIYPPLDFLVNALNTTLLINLGALLTTSASKAEFRKLAARLLGLVPDQPKQSVKETFQLIAGLVVIVTGISCFVTWIVYSREKIPPVAPFVIINGKALIGVLIGYAGYILGTKPTVQGFVKSLFG